MVFILCFYALFLLFLCFSVEGSVNGLLVQPGIQFTVWNNLNQPLANNVLMRAGDKVRFSISIDTKSMLNN